MSVFKSGPVVGAGWNKRNGGSAIMLQCLISWQSFTQPWWSLVFHLPTLFNLFDGRHFPSSVAQSLRQTELFSRVAPPWPLQVGRVVSRTILPWWIWLQGIRTLYGVLFPLPYRTFCSLAALQLCYNASLADRASHSPDGLWSYIYKRSLTSLTVVILFIFHKKNPQKCAPNQRNLQSPGTRKE